MSWFVCIISDKPFLEWEIEKFIQLHPITQNSIIKQSFYFAYDGEDDMLYKKNATEDDPGFKLVIGRGYLSKSTGYSMADGNDWDRLLSQQYSPKEIDGHYMAIKIRETFVQVTNDIYGHYPIYFHKFDDSIIITNLHYFITGVLPNKEWNLPAISALALMANPLEQTGLLTNIQVMQPGATFTYKKGKATLTNRKYNFLADGEQNIAKYLFSFKKAFELQLGDSDFLNIPFEHNFTSRFALSVWSNKPKEKWGIYYKKEAKFTPDTILDPYILTNLKITKIPDHTNINEVFKLYKNYVLTTGLSDFPDCFSSAGRFKKEADVSEINLYSPLTEWLFEKSPTEKINKIFKTFKSESYRDFKKNFIMENHFLKKDFYKTLLKGAEAHFKLLVRSVNELPTGNQKVASAYGQYHYFIKNYQIKTKTNDFAWLNNFRHFYCPGILYSLVCEHVQHNILDKKFYLKTNDLHLNFADEHLVYPKMPTKTTPLPNVNNIYFPFISNQVGQMIEEAEGVQIYDFAKLLKIFKKAVQGNTEAIKIILKWTGFEMWRFYLN